MCVCGLWPQKLKRYVWPFIWAVYGRAFRASCQLMMCSALACPRPVAAGAAGAANHCAVETLVNCFLAAFESF